MSSNGTALVTRADDTARSVSAFDGNRENFDVVVRIAQGLAASTIVPTEYRNSTSNVMVAMEYAHRLGASVLAVMQNLNIIHGKPSLSSTFLIGTVNATGRFTPLRWRWEGEPGTDTWGCRAIATDRESGEPCEGPLVSFAIVKKEGWYDRKDNKGNYVSKWRTIPELMFMYRSAGWWARLYAPEYSLGLHTSDEMEDFAAPLPQQRAQSLAAALDAGDVEEAPTEPDAQDTTPPPTGAPVEPKATPKDEDKKTRSARELFRTVLKQRRPDMAGTDESARRELAIWMRDIVGKGDPDECTRDELRELVAELEKMPVADARNV